MPLSLLAASASRDARVNQRHLSSGAHRARLSTGATNLFKRLANLRDHVANSDTLARALAPQLGGVSDRAEKSGRWVVARRVHRRIVMQSRSTFEIVVHRVFTTPRPQSGSVRCLSHPCQLVHHTQQEKVCDPGYGPCSTVQ